MGGALLVVAAAATTYFTAFAGKGSTKGDLGDIDDMDDEVEYITEDDVVKVFERLFLEMQAVVGSLSQQIQQIQMSGQMIPEKQLRQILRNEFERALSIKQQQVFDAFGIEEDCLKEAVWEMFAKEDEQPNSYPKAVKSVERFQKLWENLTGESVIGKRPGQSTSRSAPEPPMEILSPEKVVEAAEIYFGALTKTMENLVNKLKAEGKNPQDLAVAKELQMEFSAVANDKGEEALQTLGIKLNQFQKSIEANAQNPTVARSLAMLQMKQQQELAALGAMPM